MRASSSLCLMLILGGASAMAQRPRAAQGDPELPPIIYKALGAVSQPYSGIRNVQTMGAFGLRSHLESVLHNGARTRIEFPPGTPNAGQVLMDDGEERKLYRPRLHEIEVLAPNRGASLYYLERRLVNALRKGGSLTENAGQDVAGRRTQLVVATGPRGLVRQRIWIDQATGVVLKRELCDPAGKFKTGFEYRHIEFNPDTPRDAFTINWPGARVITPETRAKALGTRNGFVASGFRKVGEYSLESSRIVNLGARDVFEEVFAGTNGRVSLFHLKGNVNKARLQRFAGANFSVCTWKRNGETLALVGDISEQELQGMARDFGRS